jgi:hypothetical protein
VKIWHDDVRPAPSGWEHARTNDAAKAWLKTGLVTEISLDHDLGYTGPLPGPCENCQGSGVDPDMPEFPCPPCDGDGFVGGDVLYIAGDDDETGYDLAKWMVEHDLIPAKITIHSWNPGGAQNMAKALRDAGAEPLVKEYQVP